MARDKNKTAVLEEENQEEYPKVEARDTVLARDSQVHTKTDPRPHTAMSMSVAKYSAGGRKLVR